MIKAVIFDVGGVLLRTEDYQYRRRWDEVLALQPGESEEIVFNSDMGQAAQRGEISDEALWQWVGDTLALGGRLGAFRADFWAGDALDKDLVNMIRSLRPTYQTAIISNATDGLRVSLAEQHGIADAFDLIVVSAEERVMKPDPAIYRRALSLLGRRPEEALFVDDFAANVAAAQQLGMAAIQFRPGLGLLEEMRQLGVDTPGLADKA